MRRFAERITARSGIHVRLLVAAVFLIGTSTFFLGYMGIKTVNESLQSRFEERIRFLSKYLATNAELGILIDEKTILKRLAASLLSERDISRVVIENSTHQVLADVSKTIRGPFAVEEREVVLREMSDENDVFRTGIIKEADPLVGWVRIVYSTGEIQELLSVMTQRFAMLSTGLALASVLIFFFISHSIVSPVSRLAGAARAVSHGDYEVRVEPGTLPETKELAHAFNEMLDSVETSRVALQMAYRRMTRQKTLAEVGKFSMMIAHEVKNPLAIIRSSFDILKQDLGIPEDNLMKEYMEDEMARLNRLIEDFLLFSRPTQPRFSRVDLNSMLHDIIGRFSIQSGSSELEFRAVVPDDPFWAEADIDLISRAVSNVIKNACEANGNRGIVEIEVEPEQKMWHFRVIDHGPGIGEDSMEKLFEPFFTTKSKGTGLGLAFVHHVVTAHGGRVTAQNRPGNEGAMFDIWIPEHNEALGGQ